MPELPEVETIKTGLQVILGEKIQNVKIHHFGLRYPIDKDIIHNLQNKTILQISRRGKYLIMDLSIGYLVIHLGMSGSITLKDSTANYTKAKHDHFEITLNNFTLWYNDPRRFGVILYTENSPYEHKLLNHLGVEPLTEKFTAEYLSKQLTTKKTTIKQAIMDHHIVVGVGNIYACEALFLAKVAPTRIVNTITKIELSSIVNEIKSVLTLAIKLGGSSLRDYKHVNEETGKFQTIHNVYGKAGKKCQICQTPIKDIRLGQRNSFYCPTCQK
jgi:formamidopyrimidine-DNA glycosylase